MILTEIFFHIISLSLMGSILAIGILAVKRLFGLKLGARLHYCIWFLLVLRLLVPFTPASPFNVFEYIPHYQQTIGSLLAFTEDWSKEPAASGQTSNSIVDTTQGKQAGIINDGLPQTTPSQAGQSKSTQPQATQSQARSPWSWFNWHNAALVWMLGIAAIFSYIFLINALVLLKIRKLPPCGSEEVLGILKESRQSLGIRPEIPVIYDDNLKSPAIFGLLAPKIIISPGIIKKLSPEELRYIFVHELSHVKRHDLFINALILALQTIYWFNPLIWYALYQMRQDCEMACDATALTSLEKEDHKKYGQTIISLLQILSEPNRAPGTLGFASKFNKRRIVMISTFRKTTIKWAAAALALILLAGCTSLNSPITSAVPGSNPKDTAAVNQSDASSAGSESTDANNTAPASDLPSTSTDSRAVVYNNAQYGFDFSLPGSWRGYTIAGSLWEGLATGGESGEKVLEKGPMISIRDPQWTSEVPRQDIPIMVFTLKQWDSLQKGEFHIGAAPVGPSELGRNKSYVFALPARYNYAFLPGYEEVERIIESKPLKAADPVQASPASVKLLLSEILTLAKQGKAINIDFAAKTNTLQDVEKAWGKADKTGFVAAAKGFYATYGSHNAVFGTNKGDQIFEVRSFEKDLKAITISQAEEVLGKPAYDVRAGGQEIIGYTAGGEFKIEMVFPQPSQTEPDPGMDHYNVLYPKGTVNNMADDPGREW